MITVLSVCVGGSTVCGGAEAGISAGCICAGGGGVHIGTESHGPRTHWATLLPADPQREPTTG